ncbi:hypothetical protein BGZ54_006537 [Gamsiella multidivaricata]|nr:hypothetical protein BGZ54_006537 [Gamsiella multidivaricata]
MTSTMRQPLPQLRIIQQQFDRPDKRRYSTTTSSQSAGNARTSREDSMDGCSGQLSSGEGSSQSSTSEPPNKIRKKPGRKPNPASPAVRKEQNRAAQRAFRDRKERHLQEMETTIRELRETNSQITQRSQQDAQQFKAALEALQSENYYLRQVVFSFETALSKGGHVTMLHEVKAELYHRHYEKHITKKPAGTTSSARNLQPPSPTIPSIFLPNGNVPLQLNLEKASQRTQGQILGQAALSSALWDAFEDSRDDTIFSVNDSILSRSTSPLSLAHSTNGKLVKSITAYEPMSVPRPFFTETGAYLAKRTEYTKNGTVFDELQSSLFPPGTLQSIVHTGLATPLEIVNDISLLDQLHDRRPLRDPVISPGQAAITFSASPIDSWASAPTSILDDEDSNEFQIASITLGLDDGLKQDVIPSVRLQLEIQVLASAPPAVDPNIDPKIYALPHDLRIDLIPCPRLRAQMILHQKRFDVDEMCHLLLNGAICHGHPLDPTSWELPEPFFDRYGFLLGEELLELRNKVWPKKDEPLPEISKAH